MRILEITLKLLFLGLSVFLFITDKVESQYFTIFLVVSLLLGIVLISNQKNPSYKYPANYPKYGRVIFMRRIEGVLLVLFTVASLIIIYA